MEGPYRDLGGGFARLLGAEGARRRSPGRLRFVEDALFELLRNSRDAGARNIYVASSLKARRYRQLVVIDDGSGIPETHQALIFEPGVTTRHLNPVPRDDHPHGAGLSLYHIKNASLSTEVLSASSPTSIKAIFDTKILPEKTLQTTPRPGSRPSKTNLHATLTKFAAQEEPAPRGKPRLYHASSNARILARLLNHRIIQQVDEGVRATGLATGRLREAARGLGLEVSLRTVQRVVAGEVPVAEEVVVSGLAGGLGAVAPGRRRPKGVRGPILSVGADELAEIRAILRRVARSSYLDLEGLDIERRPGEVILIARIYEPEEEYEQYE